MRALAILAALLAAGSAAGQTSPWYFAATAIGPDGESAYSNEAVKVMGPGDSIDLTWTPPMLNTDGAPVTLLGYRFYAGTASRAYSQMMTALDPSITMIVWPDVVGALPMLPADPVAPPLVTWTRTPPPSSVTVTMQQGSAADQFNVIVTGSGLVQLQLVPVGAVFDFLKVGGTTSADIPGVSPALGGNNDGRSANTITVQGPANGWTDLDGSAMTGVSAMLAGISKPLVRSGTTWSASF